jgi:hypothetical protein
MRSDYQHLAVPEVQKNQNQERKNKTMKHHITQILFIAATVTAASQSDFTTAPGTELQHRMKEQRERKGWSAIIHHAETLPVYVTNFLDDGPAMFSIETNRSKFITNPTSLRIKLTAATNWTGVANGTNELGYVTTNHQAQVIYEGATNLFLLKSVPTSIAVWRPVVPITNGFTLTNLWLPGVILTNTGKLWWTNPSGFTNYWLKGATP